MPDSCTPADVDLRLASVLKNIKAGRPVGDTWEFFSVNYFRGCSDDEAAKLLRAWCDRHGVEAKLSTETMIAGGRKIQVIALTLRAAD